MHNCIIEQDQEHLLERIAIGEDTRVQRRCARELPIWRKQLGLMANIIEQWLDGQWFAMQRLPGIYTRECEKLIDQPNHPVDFVFGLHQNIAALFLIHPCFLAQ